MQQRAHSAPDSLEYFPTPPWATRALCRFLSGDRGLPPLARPLIEDECDLTAMSAWEPACGEMHMARPMAEYFGSVRATDVFRYGPDHGICDFLTTGRTHPPVDWLITNPPFPNAADFVEVGQAVAREGVAMLVRSAWLEGGGRFRDTFSHNPPSYVLTFTERVVMLQGRLIQTGKPDPFNLDEKGAPRKASSATSYSWVIWQRDGRSWGGDTRHRWVPPSRTELERPGDYPDYSALLAEIEARACAQREGETLFSTEGS